MNFSCNKCQRRYSIADDKVRGKTVKVRCKNCQNVISVEGPPEQVEESTRVVSLADVERLRAQARAEEEQAAQLAAAAAAPAPEPAVAAPTPGAGGSDPSKEEWEDEPTRAAPMPLPQPTATWYAMVEGQQQGPLEEHVLKELVASGAVSSRSYFWQPGLADWKRGEEIPELAALFAPAAPPPAPAPARAAPAKAAPAKAARAAPTPEDFDENTRPYPPGTENPESEDTRPYPDTLGQPEPKKAAQPKRPQRAVAPEPEPEPAPAPAAAAAPRRAQRAAPRPEPEPESPPASTEQRPLYEGGGESEPEEGARANAAAGGDLGGLFSDLDLPERPEEGQPAADPFAGMESQPRDVEPPPSLGDEQEPMENTRHYMAKAGVNRRNPPWKIALLVVGVLVLLLGLPLGVVAVLQQLQVMKPLTVTRVNALGQPERQEVSVFSAEGVGELRDLLLGNKKEEPPPPPPPAAEPPKAETKPRPVEPKTESGTGAPSEQDQALAAKYAESGKTDVGPEVRKEAEVAAADSAAGGAPSQEALMKVVGQSQPAFQSCIEQELRKNPSFKGGKVMMTVVLGSSGAVKSVSFDRKDLGGSPLGECLTQRAKRMVFPAFSGDDVDVQVPLVISNAG